VNYSQLGDDFCPLTASLKLASRNNRCSSGYGDGPTKGMETLGYVGRLADCRISKYT